MPEIGREVPQLELTCWLPSAKKGSEPMRKPLLILTIFTWMSFLAACAAAPAAQEITITAQGMTYQPASFEVTAGQPVRLVLQNDDVVEHDFSIMAFPMSGMSSQQEDMPGHNMGDMATQPELHVAAPVGGQGVLEFTPSKPGTYTFSCTIAGHMEAGMLGTLTVRAR